MFQIYFALFGLFRFILRIEGAVFRALLALSFPKEERGKFPESLCLFGLYAPIQLLMTYLISRNLVRVDLNVVISVAYSLNGPFHSLGRYRRES